VLGGKETNFENNYSATIARPSSGLASICLQIKRGTFRRHIPVYNTSNLKNAAGWTFRAV
jgi:hypothetical protein